MTLYAIVTRNDHALPHNQDAWLIEVFSDEDPYPERTRLAYNRNMVRGKISEQLLSELSIAGRYIAALEDVVLMRDHYRINNVRRIE